MEKVVLFDWGGIVESHRSGEYNFFTATENMIKTLTNNQYKKDIIEEWNRCNKVTDKLITEINNMEDINLWFNNLKNSFNFDCSFEEFVKIYKYEYSKVIYYKDVVEFAHSLKNKCKIGILSNLCFLDKERINLHYDLSKFDYVFLSFELKCKKPDKQIYEKVEKQLQIENKNILFIDDKKENIDAANNRGWTTCMAYGYELDKIKKSVNDFLNSK